MFSSLPGHTNLIEHHIGSPPGVAVRSCPCRIPEHKAMLDMGVIEESQSDWSSLVALVPKANMSVHFCVDFINVNMVSKYDIPNSMH